MRRAVIACALAASLLRLSACGAFSADAVSPPLGDASALDATTATGDADDSVDASNGVDGESLADADAGVATLLCSPNAPFGSFSALPGLTQLAGAAAARLTADELSIYFQANPTNTDYGVYVSTRANVGSAWSSPATLPSVDLTAVTEGNPSPFPNGLALVFEDDRNNMGQGTWLGTRASPSASFTVPAAALAQTPGVDEGQPFYDPIQQRVYFISDSTARSGLVGAYDVIQGELVSGALKNVKSVPGINSIADDSHPTLSADALAIYFVSKRGGSPAVWVAQRSTLADNFGDPVLAADFDGDIVPSWFSPDGCRVYATRTIDGGMLSEIVTATRPPL